ncbi:AAA family ATPase [Yinghuangia sp. ASG 101]|uniref:AAA family ATPase n=1 Tax=Yinghuangia sp. ASG 101 TaxID=2896848 RepID=UPI001E4EBD86|nr:AAA family ATPase [Yinghuangia sp. ASG 101]UGQ13043.1 AAA family ATPase [Yinghuangia sp. ASG 101]
MAHTARAPQAGGTAEHAWLRGMDAYVAGEYGHAETEFRTAVDHDPGMADAWLGLHALKVDVAGALVAMHRHRGRFGEQRLRYGRPLNSWYWLGWWVQLVLETPRDLALAHASHWLDGRHLPELDAALAHCPSPDNDAATRFLLACRAYLGKDWRQLLRHTSGLEDDPLLGVEAGLFAGMARVRLGLYDKAEHVLATALARCRSEHPQRKELRYWLARAYEETGRAPAARPLYRAVHRADPGFMDTEVRLTALDDEAADTVPTLLAYDTGTRLGGGGTGSATPVPPHAAAPTAPGSGGGTGSGIPVPRDAGPEPAAPRNPAEPSDRPDAFLPPDTPPPDPSDPSDSSDRPGRWTGGEPPERSGPPRADGDSPGTGGTPPARGGAPANGGSPAAPAPAAAAAEDLASALVELERMVGLEPVKQQIRALSAQMRMSRLRTARGLPATAPMRHFVFSGPSGTGKTTVARLLGRIFHALGLLESDRLVEAQRPDLVGEYLGQTAVKTGELIDSALGGVLFVDEAYALAGHGYAKGDAYGDEAVQVLLKRAEDDRDRLVVVLAGYPEGMDRLLASNPGLLSRFAARVEFPSYDDAELARIADHLAATGGDVWDDDCRAELRSIMAYVHEQGWVDELGNARFVRTLYEKACAYRDLRLVGLPGDPDGDELTTLRLPDLVQAYGETAAGRS